MDHILVKTEAMKLKQKPKHTIQEPETAEYELLWRPHTVEKKERNSFVSTVAILHIHTCAQTKPYTFSFVA